MIRLVEVSKAFDPRRPILQNVTVDLPKGQNVGILGVRRAGKSTVVGLLARSIAPDAGTIQTDSTVSWPVGSRRAFAPALTFRNNIRIASLLYGARAPDVIESVRSFADPGPYMDRSVSSAPRRVQLAFAYGLSFAIGFDYYLADESLQISDAILSERIANAVHDRRGRSTFIIATRHPRLVREYCDLAYILSNGSLIRYDNINDAIRVFRGL